MARLGSPRSPIRVFHHSLLSHSTFLLQLAFCSSPPDPVEVVENDVESMSMAKIAEFWQPKSNPLKRIMEALFPNLESELSGFLNQGHTIDGYNSLYALVRMSEHVSSAQSPQSGSFLAITFGSCLIQVGSPSLTRAFPRKSLMFSILPVLSDFVANH